MDWAQWRTLVTTYLRPHRRLVVWLALALFTKIEAVGVLGAFWAFELWQPLIHVPLMIMVPGATPKRIDRNRSAIDLAPTILAAAGTALRVVHQCGANHVDAVVGYLAALSGGHPAILVPGAVSQVLRQVGVRSSTKASKVLIRRYVSNDTLKLIVRIATFPLRLTPWGPELAKGRATR